MWKGRVITLLFEYFSYPYHDYKTEHSVHMVLSLLAVWHDKGLGVGETEKNIYIYTRRSTTLIN